MALCCTAVVWQEVLPNSDSRQECRQRAELLAAQGSERERLGRLQEAELEVLRRAQEEQLRDLLQSHQEQVSGRCGEQCLSHGRGAYEAALAWVLHPATLLGCLQWRMGGCRHLLGPRAGPSRQECLGSKARLAGSSPTAGVLLVEGWFEQAKSSFSGPLLEALKNQPAWVWWARSIEGIPHRLAHEGPAPLTPLFSFLPLLTHRGTDSS